MSYFLFILRVFNAMQALFFMGGGAEGCLWQFKGHRYRKNSILEEIQDLENKMNASWSIFSFFLQLQIVQVLWTLQIETYTERLSFTVDTAKSCIKQNPQHYPQNYFRQNGTFWNQGFCRKAGREKQKLFVSLVPNHASVCLWKFPHTLRNPFGLSSCSLLPLDTHWGCKTCKGSASVCSQSLFPRLFPLMLHTGRQGALWLSQCLVKSIILKPFCADSIA